MVNQKKYLGLEGIEELKSFISEYGILKQYSKNDFFIRKGHSFNHIGFIIKGGFKYLGYSSDGREQILGYSFESDFVADYPTFQTMQPPVIDIQSITNSTVKTVSHDELNSFFEHCEVVDLRSKIAESLLSDLGSRLLSMYCDMPEERYIKLIKRYPDILTLVNLKEIASLIKVTPETLSRIRKILSLQRNS